MPRKPRNYRPCGYYHVINRGVGKKSIFEDEQDYKYFVKLMIEHSAKNDITIYAYCLMKNHFHILLSSNGDSLSIFMQHICSLYSMYYNDKYERVGHLFQDRFKSEEVLDESYFLTAFRYIIRNPEKAGICKVAKYRWHSLYLPSSVNKFVNLSLPIKLGGGIDRLKEYVLTPNNDVCMEAENVISDEEATEIILRQFHVKDCKEIMDFSKDEKIKAIKKLSHIGLSQRQIERLTGVTRQQVRTMMSK